ncbi:hypothetical protein BN903_196 [Halorubrum sp. AJ67]|nr:hypothetical protein BN903_196 [Halorubrum sp. AJ67]
MGLEAAQGPETVVRALYVSIELPSRRLERRLLTNNTP